MFLYFQSCKEFFCSLFSPFRLVAKISEPDPLWVDRLSATRNKISTKIFVKLFAIFGCAYYAYFAVLGFYAVSLWYNAFPAIAMFSFIQWFNFRLVPWWDILELAFTSTSPPLVKEGLVIMAFCVAEGIISVQDCGVAKEKLLVTWIRSALWPLTSCR